MLDAARAERADQASGLRRLFRPRGLRVLPLASAVEKARDPVELARAFARAGERVLILDHGWGCGAASVQGADLAAVLRGQASIQAATRHLTENVGLLAVGSGFSLMNDTGMKSEQLFFALRQQEQPVDLVMVPTRAPYALAAMLGDSGEFLVLAGGTSAGIASAYRLLKSIAATAPRVRLVFDGVERQTNAEDAFRRIETTAARFLGVVPLLGGWLPRESSVAVTRGGSEGTGARQAADRIARAALQWQLAEFPRSRDSMAGGIPESRWSLTEAAHGGSGYPHGLARSAAAGEACVAPVRTVRRARTRREW
jgi:hypothetical protein